MIPPTQPNTTNRESGAHQTTDERLGRKAF
jgi:hypothetical protein